MNLIQINLRAGMEKTMDKLYATCRLVMKRIRGVFEITVVLCMHVYC